MDFLLIPGAGGRAWFWSRLVPELERRGHRAVAVDLPAGDPTAGLDDYVDTAVEAAAGLSSIVVVGQSMGGLTAPLLCGPLDVVEVVLLNAMVPRSGETGGAWWEVTGHEEAVDAPEGADFDEWFFLHDLPDDVRREADEAPEVDQSDRPFADPWPLETWPDVPTRVIAAAEDRFFPLAFQQRVAQERLGLEPVVVPGGHLAALSRPAELADALLAPF